jgi:hypothetical protein
MDTGMIKKLIITILLGLTFFGNAQMTKEQYIAYFESEWYSGSQSSPTYANFWYRYNESLEPGNKGDAGIYFDQSIYYVAWGLATQLDMWRATGNNQYLDELIQMAYNMINKSRFVAIGNGSTYYGWPGVTPRDAPENDIVYPIGVPLWESYAFRYFTTMLRIMKDSPVLLASAHNNGNFTGTTYQNVYDYLLSWIEKHMWEKWKVSGLGNLYRSNTHMASHWARIGMDLHYCTNNQEYYEVFANITFAGFPSGTSYIGANFQDQLRINTSVPSAYDWSATWFNQVSPQDTDHAGDIIVWVAESFDIGYYWTQTDIDRFASTFKDVMWLNKNSEPMLLEPFVNGAGTPTDVAGYKAYGWWSMARWNDDLYNLARTYITNGNAEFSALEPDNVAGIILAVSYQENTIQYPETKRDGVIVTPPPLPPTPVVFKKNEKRKKNVPVIVN